MTSTPGGGGPHLDRVVLESIPDNTSRVAALTGGELSGASGLVPEDLPSIEQNINLTVAFRPPLTSGHISINIQKEPSGYVRGR